MTTSQIQCGEPAERIDWSKTKEYAQGVDAFRAGSGEDDYPYPIKNPSRMGWFTGYFDTRTGTRLAGPFRRLGITWPVICLLLCGCLVNPTPGPGPTPGPSSDAATVSHDATVAYSQLVADVMRDASSKLKAGELKTDREAIDYIAKATEAARKAAFAPVGKLIQDQVGGDKWDPTKAAAVFQGIEAGHRKVR